MPLTPPNLQALPPPHTSGVWGLFRSLTAKVGCLALPDHKGGLLLSKPALTATVISCCLSLPHHLGHHLYLTLPAHWCTDLTATDSTIHYVYPAYLLPVTVIRPALVESAGFHSELGLKESALLVLRL